MLTLFALKISAALTVTFASAFGAWAPLCAQQRSRHRPMSSSSSLCGKGRLLSLANCFSAGMLLAMALVHTLPSACIHARDFIATTTLCGCVLAGLLFPALIERAVGGKSGAEEGNGSRSHAHTHSHVQRHTHGSFFAPDASISAVSTLLLILMCFHGTIEGILIGAESSSLALLSSAIPLIVHRLFDGIVVGVALAKELQRYMDVDSPTELISLSPTTPLTSAGTNDWSITLQRMCRPGVIMWLAMTPVATLIAAVIPFMASVSERYGGKRNTTVGFQSHGETLLATAQAVGSGSFIFVALTALGQEELHGASACAALLAGVAAATFMSALDHG